MARSGLPPQPPRTQTHTKAQAHAHEHTHAPTHTHKHTHINQKSKRKRKKRRRTKRRTTEEKKKVPPRWNIIREILNLSVHIFSYNERRSISMVGSQVGCAHMCVHVYSRRNKLMGTFLSLTRPDFTLSHNYLYLDKFQSHSLLLSSPILFSLHLSFPLYSSFPIVPFVSRSHSISLLFINRHNLSLSLSLSLSILFPLVPHSLSM